MIVPQTQIGLNGELAPLRPCFNDLNILDIISKVVEKDNVQNKDLIEKIMSTCTLVMNGTASESVVREAMSPYTEYELDLFCLSNFEICEKLESSITHWVTKYGIEPPFKKNSLVIASDHLGTNFICEVTGFNKATASYILSVHQSNTSMPVGNLVCSYESVALLSDFFDPNRPR